MEKLWRKNLIKMDKRADYGAYIIHKKRINKNKKIKLKSNLHHERLGNHVMQALLLGCKAYHEKTDAQYEDG